MKTNGVILFIGTGQAFEKASRRWNVPSIELRCFNGLNANSVKFIGYTQDLSAGRIDHYRVTEALNALDERIKNGTNMPNAKEVSGE